MPTLTFSMFSNKSISVRVAEYFMMTPPQWILGTVSFLTGFFFYNPLLSVKTIEIANSLNILLILFDSLPGRKSVSLVQRDGLIQGCVKSSMVDYKVARVLMILPVIKPQAVERVVVVAEEGMLLKLVWWIYALSKQKCRNSMNASLKWSR